MTEKKGCPNSSSAITAGLPGSHSCKTSTTHRHGPGPGPDTRCHQCSVNMSSSPCFSDSPFSLKLRAISWLEVRQAHQSPSRPWELSHLYRDVAALPQRPSQSLLQVSLRPCLVLGGAHSQTAEIPSFLWPSALSDPINCIRVCNTESGQPQRTLSPS